MWEINKRFGGWAVDLSISMPWYRQIEECVKEINSKGANRGEYRLRVQWLSEEDLKEEARRLLSPTEPKTENKGAPEKLK